MARSACRAQLIVSRQQGVGSVNSYLNAGYRLAGSLALAVTLSTGTAVAQDGPIEEVVVTATKRAVNLQDLGQSVTAFTEQGLERAGMNDIARLEHASAGISYGVYGNDAKIAMRGANSNNTFSDNTSIAGMFVDGVYKPRASQQTRAFYDVNRLEVLKGPQGTLYGRNTFAGAINLITNNPEFNDHYGNLEFTAARFGLFRTKAVYNAGISDTFALRFAMLQETSDGWIENSVAANYGIEDNISYRISARWAPTDELDIIARFSHAEEDGTYTGIFSSNGVCRSVTANGLTDPLGAFDDCLSPLQGALRADGAINWRTQGLLDVERDWSPRGDLEEDNVTVDITWSGDRGFDIKSVTAFTDYTSLSGYDGDLSGNPHSRFFNVDNAQSFSQELQLISNDDGPLKWNGGLYYSEDETEFAFSIFRHTLADNSVRQMAPDDDGNLLTVITATPLVSRDTNYNGVFGDHQLVDITTIGVFARVEYDLTDTFRVIGGLRYNSEDKDSIGGNNFTADDAGDGLVVNFLTPDVADPIPEDPNLFIFNPNDADATRPSKKFTKTTWHAGLEWNLADDSLAYFTASTGFLSGSLNINGSITDQQESQAYEFGWKGRLLDDRMQLNVALYRNEYTNLATQTQQTIGGIVITSASNGGEIDANGLEIEMFWVPVDPLTIGLNAAFLDSEFGAFGTANPYQLYGGVQQGFIDLSGTEPPLTPDVQLSLNGSYEFELANGALLTPTLQVSYSDDYHTHGFNIAAERNARNDAYTKTDFRLKWSSPEGRYAIEAFVENIEDEVVVPRYQLGGDDFTQTTPLYPRNYGVRAKVSFE